MNAVSCYRFMHTVNLSGDCSIQAVLMHRQCDLQVCGTHAGILPGHLTSSNNSSSNSSSINGSAAAKATAALATSAPPLADVLGPHACNSQPAWCPGSAPQRQQQRLPEQQNLQQQEQQAEHEQLLVHSLTAYRVVKAPHAPSDLAAASSNGGGGRSSSTSSNGSTLGATEHAGGSSSSSNARHSVGNINMLSNSSRRGRFTAKAPTGAGHITSCIKRCTCWQEVSSTCVVCSNNTRDLISDAHAVCVTCLANNVNAAM